MKPPFHLRFFEIRIEREAQDPPGASLKGNGLGILVLGSLGFVAIVSDFDDDGVFALVFA